MRAVFAQVVGEVLSTKVTFNLILEWEGAEEITHLYSDFHQKDKLTNFLK